MQHGANPVDETVRRFTIPNELHGARLDQALAPLLDPLGLSREKGKAFIREGRVRLDNEPANKPSLKVKAGQRLSLALPAGDRDGSLTPQAGELAVLHQDEDLLVLAKPPGLTVHPAPGMDEATLVHRLLHHFPLLADMEGLRPGIVHRLDKDTSGLMLVALNERTRLSLSRDFEARRVRKEYLAVVHGVLAEPSGRIDLPLGRHPVHKIKMAVLAKGGKPALTEYQTLFADPLGRFSLLKIRLHTGRTHQIRVHFHHLGHALVGDKVYRGPAPADPLLARPARRQMLHACDLAFMHPSRPGDAPLSFHLPPPRDFAQVLLRLSRTLQRVVLTGLPGCGKSSLAALIAASGVPVFSADRVVAELYAPGNDGWDFLSRRFGDRFLDEGRIDKAKLFAAMRDSRHLRREVEEALHPMVWYRLERFWAEHAGRRLAVAEIPLFLESGPEMRRAAADLVVGVHCPQALRRERLAVSRGWDPAMFAAMESWQWPEADKMRACDLVLDNSLGPEELGERAASLLRILAGLRRGRMRRLHALFRGLFAVP